MVVPCAQLRVFVPVETLDERDAARWAAGGSQIGHSEARRREERAGRARLLTGRGSVPDAAVLIRRIGEAVYVCPLQFDLRSAAGLRRLRTTVPEPVVDLLVPDRGLRDRLDRVAATGQQPTIVDAPWVIPIPWFVLFTDEDRRLLDPAEGHGSRLLHLTTVGTALGRLDRAIEAIDDAIDDADDLLDELTDVTAWIGSFDERSLVELDYAGLTRLLSHGQLALDRSARDVWCAIEGLESGDLLAAVAHYGALRGRWSALRAQMASS